MSNIFIVDEESQDIRIDKYLSGLLTDNSRTYIQKLIKENNILVNNKACKANYKVQAEDKIIVDIPEPIYADIEPEDIPLDIIFEDNDVLRGVVVSLSAFGNFKICLLMEKTIAQRWKLKFIKRSKKFPMTWRV